MDKWIMCVVALILGMLIYHMLKSDCGCKTVEGTDSAECMVACGQYKVGSEEYNTCSRQCLPVVTSA